MKRVYRTYVLCIAYFQLHLLIYVFKKAYLKAQSVESIASLYAISNLRCETINTSRTIEFCFEKKSLSDKNRLQRQMAKAINLNLSSN